MVVIASLSHEPLAGLAAPASMGYAELRLIGKHLLP